MRKLWKIPGDLLEVGKGYWLTKTRIFALRLYLPSPFWTHISMMLYRILNLSSPSESGLVCGVPPHPENSPERKLVPWGGFSPSVLGSSGEERAPEASEPPHSRVLYLDWDRVVTEISDFIQNGCIEWWLPHVTTVCNFSKPQFFISG